MRKTMNNIYKFESNSAKSISGFDFIMSFTVIVFITSLSLSLGNTYLGGNHIQRQKTIERSQRINNERSRKEGFDKFKMKRRETFVVTPAFEMNVLESSNRILQPIENTKVKSDGHNLRFENNDEEKEIQNENYSISATTETQDDYNGMGRKGKRYNTHSEHVAYNSKEAVMKVVSKQNDLIAELVSLYQEEINRKQFREILDSVKQRNYDKCVAERQVQVITDKIKREGEENKKSEKEKTKDKDTSADKDESKKKNEDTEKGKTKDKDKSVDEDENKNKDTENEKTKDKDTSKDKDENKNNDTENKKNKDKDTSADKDESKKKNEDTEKGKTKDKDKSVDEDENKKKNEDTEKDKAKDKDKSVDEDKNEKKNEDTEKDEVKDKQPPDEEKDNKVTTPQQNNTHDTDKLSFITLDEEEVKKKLLESPLVRRILSRVEKKKQQFLSRRRQEKELQKKGWQ